MLEKEVRNLQALIKTNQAPRDAAPSTADLTSAADLTASSSADPTFATSIADVTSATPEEPEETIPLWWGLNEPVDEHQLSLAQHCEVMGLHRVGEHFLKDTAGVGWEEGSWGWFQKMRDRGMSMFGLRGEDVLMKPKARYKCYAHGSAYFTAFVICEHCCSMFTAKFKDKKQFGRADDEAIMKFFLMKPLACPEAIDR